MGEGGASIESAFLELNSQVKPESMAHRPVTAIYLWRMSLASGTTWDSLQTCQKLQGPDSGTELLGFDSNAVNHQLRTRASSFRSLSLNFLL